MNACSYWEQAQGDIPDDDIKSQHEMSSNSMSNDLILCCQYNKRGEKQDGCNAIFNNICIRKR